MRVNRDLTEGEPAAVIRKFCLPLFGSVIFQQLYNIADSFVAGRFIGGDALAAVGNSYEITLIFIAFAFGCNIGCSVVAAGFYGAKKYGMLKTAVHTALISSGVLCAVLMTAGWLSGGALLGMINTPPDIMADSVLYLNIYILGLPFVFFYNISTGVFSALGDSKTPFIFLVCSSLSNIAVDILFVKAFGMGVDGVAWATFICQGVSCVLAVLFVLRRLSKTAAGSEAGVFSFKILKQIARIAVPSILQQSFISVGNIIIQGVINAFGTGVIAGYSAAVKLNNMLISSLTTVGNGISSYTAQNLGAEKYRRIHSGFKAGLHLVWAISVPVALLYFFFGKYLVLIFLDNPGGDAAQAGLLFLRTVAPFYLIAAAKLTADGVLRGGGLMKKFMAATLLDLFLRVVFAVLLSKTALGVLGVWLSWPIGWCAAAALSLLFYYREKRKLI